MTPENLGFNQSACSMDFPEDVVTLILVRLPVKSLLRFRCVCKAWCGLIGSRRFADMHLRHPSQGRENEYLVLKRSDSDSQELHTVLSFYRRDGELLTAAAPDWRPAVGMEFIGGPVNGICLFSTLDRTVEGWKHHYFEPQHSLYLCNPATREFRKIPDRPFGRQRARPPTVFGIYANPFDCRRASVGFGYDPLTNDYKVVSIMFFLENRYTYGFASVGPLKIEIYELSSNSWRVADTVFPTDFHPHPDPYYDFPIHSRDFNYDTTGEGGDTFKEFTCGLFFNGCIHWHTAEAILAFNVSDEVMRAFNLPRANG